MVDDKEGMIVRYWIAAAALTLAFSSPAFGEDSNQTTPRVVFLYPDTFQFVPGCPSCVWGYVLNTTNGQLWQVAHWQSPTLLSSPVAKEGMQGRYRLVVSDYKMQSFNCVGSCSSNDNLQHWMNAMVSDPSRRLFLEDTATGEVWVWTDNWVQVSPALSNGDEGDASS